MTLAERETEPILVRDIPPLTRPRLPRRRSPEKYAQMQRKIEIYQMSGCLLFAEQFEKVLAWWRSEEQLADELDRLVALGKQIENMSTSCLQEDAARGAGVPAPLSLH